MTLDSRLIGRRRIYVCTRGLAWQDFEARKEGVVDLSSRAVQAVYYFTPVGFRLRL